jgi:hypothetical protein
MKAKIGAIFLVSVMAFAAIGAAYAHWEETLTITGVMETDDIAPGFYCPKSNDPIGCMDRTGCGTWDYVAQQNDAGYRDKNVGTTTVNVVGNENEELQINVEDAYPCYYAHPMFCVQNHGSCPVQVYAVRLVEVSYKNDTVDEKIPVNKIMAVDDPFGIQILQTAAGAWKVRFHDDVNNTLDDFSLMLTGQDFAEPTQLDPIDWYVGDGHLVGDRVPRTTLYGDLCIHFENGCEQDTTYDFVIELVFWNWPEVAQTW